MLKNKLTNEKLDLKSSIYKRITNPFYLIAVALTAIGTYGFYLANPSPSIDWLSYDRYYSGVLFGQGRFTATIVERVLGLWNCPVWFEPILGLVCFILGTLIMLAIFDGFIEYKSIVPSIVFTCIYITFPLLPEYFIYNGAILTVGSCTVLLSLALYFRIKYRDFSRGSLLPIILLIFVVSGYECMILPYIGMVFALFILIEHESGKLKFKEIIVKGFYFAFPLGLSVILEFIITRILIKLFSIKINNNANISTLWTKSPNPIISLFSSYFSNWFSKIFFNPAFAVLFAAGIIFFVLFIIRIKKTKSFSSVLLFLGSLLPVFAMTLYRCGGAEFRTEQGMPFFVAFTAFLLSLHVKSGKKFAQRLFASVFVFALIIQIGASNKSYWINNQRYEEEKNVILNLNSRITENFDSSKPVVFIGSYKMSDNLMEKITIDESTQYAKALRRFLTDKSYHAAIKKYDYIGNSYLAWSARYPFDADKPDSELYKFCNYIGVSFKQCTKEQFDEAKKKYSKIKPYPSKDCIVETDEYIVVKLG